MTRKATDRELIDAYAELGSVHRVGERFGMRGSSAHERLVRLGVAKPINVFTDTERDRLVREYAIYRAHGRVADLAADMGRTVPFLSRKARELGLTEGNRHAKLGAGKWKHMSDAAARVLMDHFKATPLTLGQYCSKYGYSDDGMLLALRDRWPDEWEHTIESKAPRDTMYRRGRALEYRVRDHLRKLGYFAMRSPASKTPIDVLAIRPGVVLMVQCKRSGALPPAEWNSLYDLATSCGAVPVMAENPHPRAMNYWRLTDRKDGSRRRQPMEAFDPQAAS